MAAEEIQQAVILICLIASFQRTDVQSDTMFFMAAV